MEKTLKELMLKMDDTLGEMVCGVESLADVEVELGQLMLEMNIAEKKGELDYFILDNYRSIRMMSELMSYVVKDLKRNTKDTCDIYQSMFNQVVKKEKDAQQRTVTSSDNTKINNIA